MTEAVGYTRLSQDSDTSIDRQKTAIREYCETNDLELAEIRDDGEFSSGFDRDRTEYQAVKSLVNDGAVDAVVVYDKTRIGRDFDERMQFVLDLRKTDTDLHSARRGSIDLSDPTDAAVESIHAAKDDEAKREEIEKSKEAVAERLEQGYDHGHPPFGLEFDDEGKYWVPGDRFDDVLDVLRLRNDGHTYREIADDVGISTATAYRIVDRREMYVERDRLAEKQSTSP
jgi:DNA invertase Pin-like site-specific DNA recombinase